MQRPKRNYKTALMAMTLIAVTSASAQQQPPGTLVNHYCVGCHSQKLHTAGISLEGLDLTKINQDAAVWEKVYRKVGAGQMPPAGLPHPPAAESAAFTKWLGDELDRAAAEHPNPGRPTIHRLNRAEYSNTIRDLLALDIKPGAKLPADDTGYGFDNIGDVLSLSPMLIERYMSVARMVSRVAVGDTNIKPEVDEFNMPRPSATKPVRIERVSDDLPFDSAGGVAIAYHFPVDADYVIKIKMPGGPAPAEGPVPEPKILELRVPVKAGVRTVGVTFLAESAVPEVIPTFGLRRGAAARSHPSLDDCKDGPSARRRAAQTLRCAAGSQWSEILQSDDRGTVRCSRPRRHTEPA